MPETAVIGYPHDIKGEGACLLRTLLALGPGLLYEKQTRWAGARAFSWVRLLVHVSLKWRFWVRRLNRHKC